MPKHVAPILAVALALSGCAASMGGHYHYSPGIGSARANNLVQWQTLEEGKQIAWLLEEPMIVEFFIPEGCDRCSRMNREVYSNPEIARQINRDFVPVRVDLSRNLTRGEMALGEKYGYNYDCLLVFLDWRGQVIRDAGGGNLCFTDVVTPEWFSKYLARARTVAARE